MTSWGWPQGGMSQAAYYAPYYGYPGYGYGAMPVAYNYGYGPPSPYAPYGWNYGR
jgi:hypothetical protein